ncbi:unnamed protein product [Parnassius mnemosyne]|uniref:G-protein coupled receptors family 2 profile 2 domain-containing protein n=1 Tax=Parnassius mnemosyne TaxID=213953 RepID=A0AAV1KCG3_9NEOP
MLTATKMFMIVFTLLSIIKSVTLSACDEQEILDISDGELLPNGDVVFDGVVYENRDYFINNVTGIKTACPKLVINKCCPFGTGYKTRQCVNITDSFDAPVWDRYKLIEGARAREMFRFRIGKINCTRPYARVLVSQIGQLDWSDNWHLKSDGKLFVELDSSIPPWTVQPPDKYCIDTFVYEDQDGKTHTRLDALACFLDETPPNHFEVRSTCMLLSCAFILITVAVYAWLPELRNMHGRVLMAYLLCLFVGFILMASMQIMLTIDNITPHICVVLTIVIYFALESAFFWLNVMSFDIWWTFSGKGGMTSKKMSKRFCAYSLYAFGVPTILTIILTSLEFSGLPPHPLLPMVRYQGCFLFGRSKLLYLYGPMFFLCLANIVFFIMTALRIARIKHETEMLKSKESAMHDQHRKDKQRLLLYLKLFTVMGINWILEVISALYPDADYIWCFTDVYNVLIGVTIFIIFVCKRKIFRLIKKRIKENFTNSKNNSEELKYKRTIPTRLCEDSQHQRGSVETIRTTIGMENGVTAEANTTIL